MQRIRDDAPDPGQSQAAFAIRLANIIYQKEGQMGPRP